MDRKRFPVPAGFRALLEALAREVLRSQPDDIYEFSALFFNELLNARQNYGTNPIESPELYHQFKDSLLRQASRRGLVAPNSVASAELGKQNASSQLHDVHSQGTAVPRPRDIALRDTSGKSKENKEKTPDDKAATKIQAAFRGYQVRRHPDKFGMETSQDRRKMSAPGRQEHAGDAGTIRKSASLDLLSPEAEGAATKIQAGIRGYLTRKQVQDMKRRESAAAVKIQAQMRGFLTRKHMEEQGLLSPTRRSGSRSPASKSPDIRSPEPGFPSTSSDMKEEQAATRIQAEFRGFKARKEFEREKDAATKIQAAYRGFHVRKEYADELHQAGNEQEDQNFNKEGVTDF